MTAARNIFHLEIFIKGRMTSTLNIFSVNDPRFPLEEP